jgi:hypothetical protein
MVGMGLDFDDMRVMVLVALDFDDKQLMVVVGLDTEDRFESDLGVGSVLVAVHQASVGECGLFVLTKS